MKPHNWSVLATLAGSWLWAGDAAKADEPIHRMLPLAVGNSWRYVHTKYDASTYEQLYHHQVAISISHTEVIEGHTYHVFTDVPYDEPPVPFFCVAGKRVRWEGDRLLFRERDQDVALFRFGGYPVDEIGDYSYVLPTSESDTPVEVETIAHPPGIPRRDGCLVPVGRTFTFYFGERHRLVYRWIWLGSSAVLTRQVSGQSVGAA